MKSRVSSELSDATADPTDGNISWVQRFLRSIRLFAFVGKSGLGGGGRFFAREGGPSGMRSRSDIVGERAREAVSRERGKREVTAPFLPP